MRGILKMGPTRFNKDWNGLFGVHVRMWAMGIGIMHLVFDIISLLCIIMMLQNVDRHHDINKIPGLKDYDYDDPPALPTPLSKVDPVNNRDQYVHIRDLVGALIYILVTLHMLHGIIANKPKNLLPFLVFQLSDLFFTVLEALGYLYIMKQPMLHNNYHTDDIPFRLQLYEVSAERAYVIVAFVVFAVLLWKMYAIRIIWRCYKFLTIERQLLTDLPFVITDVCQGHLGRGERNLLPDYNEAIAESLKQAPPTYQAAMAAANAKLSTSHVNPIPLNPDVIATVNENDIGTDNENTKLDEVSPITSNVERNSEQRTEVRIESNDSPKPNTN